MMATSCPRGSPTPQMVSAVVSSGSMPSSASRTTRRPETSSAASSTAAQAGSKPSRRDTSRRRRGLGATPDPANKYAHKCGFRGCRSYDRRGVAPSPTLRPKAETPVREDATESQRCQRVSRTVTSEGYAHKYTIKGGLTYFRTKVPPRVTPARANYSRESRPRRAWPGTAGRPPTLVGGARLPGRSTRSDRCGRPGRALLGSGRPDSGAPGRRSQVSFVPAVAPPSAVRGPGPRRPVHSEVFRVRKRSVVPV